MITILTDFFIEPQASKFGTHISEDSMTLKQVSTT